MRGRAMQRVWWVGVLVALLGMGLLVRSAWNGGQEITVSFSDAEGLESGRTPVRYQDVEIGKVTGVRLTPDRSRVLATVRLNGAAANLAMEDTRFWVVRPRVDAYGISGIGTLLSGTYIGVDVGRSNKPVSAFSGLDAPPGIRFAQRGMRYVLHARSPAVLEVGAPVYYRGVEVGQVTATSPASDGNGFTIDVFVEAPYHRYVVTDSRWWNVGGGHMRLDDRGFTLGVQSVTAMLHGGIAFQSSTAQAASTVAPAGTQFELAEDARAADASPGSAPAPVMMRFAQSLRGLSVGATVNFRGLELGEVTNIEASRITEDGSATFLVHMNLYPDRLGQAFRESPEQQDVTAGKALLRKLVSDGLRGQLRTGNLLSNQLYVALDLFPNAPPVRLNLNRSPIELPTVPNTLDALQAEIGAMLRTLDRAPFGPIGVELSRSFVQARRLFKRTDEQLSPQRRGALAAARALIDHAESSLDAAPSEQADLETTRLQLMQARDALEAVSDVLDRHPESYVWGQAPAF